MTIVQLHNSSSKLNVLMFLLMSILAVSAVVGILLYNQLVNLRHEITSQENSLQKAEVGSAELKNNLYTMVDLTKLEKLAAEKALVVDKNPQYVKTEPLATNY